MHTGTGLVERTIQSLKNLILTNLEDDIGLIESLNRALHVMRFTVHTGKGKTPFELHHGRKPRTKLINLTDKQTSLLSDWKKLTRETSPPKVGTSTTKRKTVRLPVTENKFPYYFVERNHQKKSFESKYKPKIQKAISETEHTVLTDKNRRVHKNQITGPIKIQPGEQLTMKFQKSSRPQSDSPRRRGERSITPKHQRRNALDRFTPNPDEEMDTVTITEQPGASTPAYESQNLSVPNLFVNSTEEGEINNSTEIEPEEGNTNLDIKTEEINDSELITERKSERNRRRPNYYGAVRYC